MKNLNQLLKAFLLAVVFTVAVMLESNAQSNWELGLRFGDPSISIDATIPLAAAPRLHAAAYFDNRFSSVDRSNFGIAGYFDWMFSLDGGPTGLKFYPGVGPELWFGDNFNFGVAGDFGVEYSFDFPLTVAFDWRPGVFFTNSIGFDGGNFGISARFRFGEGVRFQRTN